MSVKLSQTLNSHTGSVLFHFPLVSIRFITSKKALKPKTLFSEKNTRFGFIKKNMKGKKLFPFWILLSPQRLLTNFFVIRTTNKIFLIKRSKILKVKLQSYISDLKYSHVIVSIVFPPENQFLLHGFFYFFLNIIYFSFLYNPHFL